MNDVELKEINQIQRFLDGTDLISFKPTGQIESYAWIARTLKGLIILNYPTPIPTIFKSSNIQIKYPSVF
jgi:hypothetical protein